MRNALAAAFQEDMGELSVMLKRDLVKWRAKSAA
jgi:hypothetical protein